MQCLRSAGALVADWALTFAATAAAAMFPLLLLLQPLLLRCCVCCPVCCLQVASKPQVGSGGRGSHNEECESCGVTCLVQSPTCKVPPLPPPHRAACSCEQLLPPAGPCNRSLSLCCPFRCGGIILCYPESCAVPCCVLLQVPGWQVGESNSATGRWIPPPAPIGIDDPAVR
jgi:hypothetical protein